MNRIAVVTVALFALAAPALGQQTYSGNWACRINGVKAGILTVYGDGYGFASATSGDKASGTGAATGYSDGVAFKDGPLRTVMGIEAGRVVPDAASGVALQLETSDAVAMVCIAR